MVVVHDKERCDIHNALEDLRVKSKEESAKTA